jgi:hypothetical protein
MPQDFNAENWYDGDGNPAGGFVEGIGFTIHWQDGPLGRGEDRKEPNGAFVETIIEAAKQRLVYYQKTKFNCVENASAIAYLGDALMMLNRRTQRREAVGVEGTYEGN